MVRDNLLRKNTKKCVNEVYIHGLTFDMLKMKTINQWFKWNAKKLTNYPCQNCYEVLNCDTRIIYTRKTSRVLNKMQIVPFERDISSKRRPDLAKTRLI